jgi:mono/diheme cytochrome c family protein
MRHLLFLVVPLFVASLTAGCGPTIEAAARPASDVESPAAPATLAPETAQTPTEVPSMASVATATLTATPGPTNPPSPAPTIAVAPTAARAPTIASSPTPTGPLAATAGAEVVSPALIERGLQVYQQSYCGLCHQLDAAHTAGQFGPTHNHMGTTAALRIQDATYTGMARTAAEYIRESIVSPQAHIVAGYEHSQYHMPAFAKLSEADLNALVQMLLQQK